MKLYSLSDVRYIVQDYLAQHFNFDRVDLKIDSLEILEEICEPYGIEEENIVENN